MADEEKDQQESDDTEGHGGGKWSGLEEGDAEGKSDEDDTEGANFKIK